VILAWRFGRFGFGVLAIRLIGMAAKAGDLRNVLRFFAGMHGEDFHADDFLVG